MRGRAMDSTVPPYLTIPSLGTNEAKGGASRATPPKRGRGVVAHSGSGGRRASRIQGEQVAERGGGVIRRKRPGWRRGIPQAGSESIATSRRTTLLPSSRSRPDACSRGCSTGIRPRKPHDFIGYPSPPRPRGRRPGSRKPGRNRRVTARAKVTHYRSSQTDPPGRGTPVRQFMPRLLFTHPLTRALDQVNFISIIT